MTGAELDDGYFAFSVNNYLGVAGLSQLVEKDKSLSYYLGFHHLFSRHFLLLCHFF
jgi:hypothetical protein